MPLLLNIESLSSHPDFNALLDELATGVLPKPPLPALEGSAADIWRTHKGVHGSERTTFQRQNNDAVDNEELSLVGDVFLKYQLVKLLREDSWLKPGAITVIKGALENNTLARISLAYDLPSRLIAHGSEQQRAALRSSVKLQADLMEAYIGAVCESRSDDVAAAWLKELFDTLIAKTTDIVRDAYNSPASLVAGLESLDLGETLAQEPPILVDGKPGVARLQEWATQQGRTGQKPRLDFDIIETGKNSSGAPIFRGTLKIDDKQVGCAITGRRRKLIEHQLAHDAMAVISETELARH